MKKNEISKIIALSLFLTVGSSVIIPTISASAAELKTISISNYERGTSITISEFKNASEVEILDENTILIDGKIYDYSYVAGVLCESIDSQKQIGSKNQMMRSPASVAIKKAAKWVVENWPKIYNKLPNSVKQYFKLDGFMKVMDQFIGISDSIEDFFHSSFRAMGMPEWANWAITNVIMLLLPI